MDSYKFYASACLCAEQTDLLVEGIKGSLLSAFRLKCPAFLLAVLSFLQVDSFVPKDLSLFRVGAQGNFLQTELSVLQPASF